MFALIQSFLVRVWWMYSIFARVSCLKTSKFRSVSLKASLWLSIIYVSSLVFVLSAIFSLSNASVAKREYVFHSMDELFQENSIMILSYSLLMRVWLSYFQILLRNCCCRVVSFSVSSGVKISTSLRESNNAKLKLVSTFLLS